MQLALNVGAMLLAFIGPYDPTRSAASSLRCVVAGSRLSAQLSTGTACWAGCFSPLWPSPIGCALEIEAIVWQVPSSVKKLVAR